MGTERPSPPEIPLLGKSNIYSSCRFQWRWEGGSEHTREVRFHFRAGSQSRP